jgi:hypothetical protein
MATHDSLVPDWIREIEIEDTLKEAQREAARQRAIAAAFQVEAEAPAWWRALLQQLSITTDALSRIKLQGKISDLPSLSRELGVRILVWSPGLFVEQIHADLFYQPKGKEIQCSILNGGISTFAFSILANGRMGVVNQHDGTILESAEEMASNIVQRLAKQIRRQ